MKNLTRDAIILMFVGIIIFLFVEYFSPQMRREYKIYNKKMDLLFTLQGKFNFTLKTNYIGFSDKQSRLIFTDNYIIRISSL